MGGFGRRRCYDELYLSFFDLEPGFRSRGLLKNNPGCETQLQSLGLVDGARRAGEFSQQGKLLRGSAQVHDNLWVARVLRISRGVPSLGL